MCNNKPWDIGGKVIVLAAGMAVFSLFLRWVDWGVAHLSETGLEVKGYIFLVFWVYPLYLVLKRRYMNRLVGFSCSLLSFVFPIMYTFLFLEPIISKPINSDPIIPLDLPRFPDLHGPIPIFDRLGFGFGLWLYLLASLLLAFGIYKYRSPKTIINAGRDGNESGPRSLNDRVGG